MTEKTNDSGNPVLTFEGKKYLINELSNDIQESIKGLQIADKSVRSFYQYATKSYKSHFNV